MLNKDHDASDARNFKDNRSAVLVDGREILKGADWQARKKELWERCGGYCEYWVKCRSVAIDPHHRIPRSKGRDDRLSNLQALCRYHHQLVDRRKVRWSKKASKQFLALTEGHT